ncbi:MAG: AAA family ATPase [Fibromonadaceae bacterium]|nr:AAA family ATPase [Fibromonadaceae bacterium]
MRIANIKIRNFRKLKEVIVDLRDNTTVFIGANNSGKTSAMVAMRYFLNQAGYKNFNIYDFTLSNHTKIKKIGTKLENETDEMAEKRDLSLWEDILPSLDIWFDVGDDDIHYVSHIIPTLDWAGGYLGVRLQYEPKDVATFYSEYKEAFEHIKELKRKMVANGKRCDVDLFPKDILVFLERDLQKYFAIKFYVLDPAKKDMKQDSLGDSIEENPLVGLIRINEINAQRGLNDEIEDISTNDQRRLSQQLTEYYNQHLDPSKDPTEQDIEALNAIYNAQEVFATNIRYGFSPALKEIGNLGYPGFYNPNITINPQLKPTDGLDHNSALQYELDGCKDSFLPETYNGLGYQNLIFMAFKLIRFRDSWLKIGKQKTSQPVGTSIEYPPIHLVLIEEPEAHLHPQAQQVFIKQAYKILTNRKEIKTGKLTTQLIVTTHSSHITHECEFTNLRYFKRVQPAIGEIQNSTVINLSDVFGSDKDTEKFVSKYIKITHCDLFFADAAILIEGDAERILLPHFLRKRVCINQSYISLLSIGGSHAHKLKPFMETLEIPTLIITDLDATEEVEEKGKKKWVSTPVLRGAGQKTNNDTLKSWFPKKDSIDDLLGLSVDDKKQNTPYALRIAFQIPINIGNSEILPYTFEDSLIFENKAIFDNIKNAKGMIKKAASIKNAQSAFDIIRNNGFKKAEFALDLLYLSNFDDLKIPAYISEGLQWLESILQSKLVPSSLAKDGTEVNNAE